MRVAWTEDSGDTYLSVGVARFPPGRYYEIPLSDRPWAAPGAWAELLNAVLFGLGPTILVASLRGAERDVGDLAPLLGSTRAAAERATYLAPGRMRAVGVLAALGSLVFTYYDPGLWTARPRPSDTDPFFLRTRCWRGSGARSVPTNAPCSTAAKTPAAPPSVFPHCSRGLASDGRPGIDFSAYPIGSAISR